MIVLINGNQPRCGKDTAAKIIAEELSITHYKMTTPMDRAIKALYSIPESEWHRVRELEKDQPQELLLDKSYRELAIFFSEKFLKVLHNRSVFAELSDREITSSVVISDIGFIEEVEYFSKNYDSVYLIRITKHATPVKKEGEPEVKDSRFFLDSPEVNTLVSNVFDINNTFDDYLTFEFKVKHIAKTIKLIEKYKLNTTEKLNNIQQQLSRIEKELEANCKDWWYSLGK